MAEDTQLNELISLTADIVSAHVSNNSVAPAEVSTLIQNIYQALSGLGAPVEMPAPEKPKGAVGVRASVKPEHLISMIDGKPYKMLRRHIGQHGYTPESYRETFRLPRDYPLVAANYAEQRRTLAHKIGLGRKPKTAAASKTAAAPKAAAASKVATGPKAATKPAAKTAAKPRTGAAPKASARKPKAATSAK